MGTVVTALLLFAGTVLDDLFALAVLLAAAKNKKSIALGWGAGLLLSFALGLLGGRAAGLVLHRYLRLLGLVPIGLGLYVLLKKEEEREKPAAVGFSGALLTALSCSGDNLAVYIPALAGLAPGQTALTAAVYLLCTAGFCLLAACMPRLPAAEKHGRVILPCVLLLLGLSVLLR